MHYEQERSDILARGRSGRSGSSSRLLFRGRAPGVAAVSEREFHPERIATDMVERNEPVVEEVLTATKTKTKTNQENVSSHLVGAGQENATLTVDIITYSTATATARPSLLSVLHILSTGMARKWCL